MIRPLLVLALALLASAPAAAQYVEPHPVTVHLWPNGAPGSEARRNEPEVAKDYWVANVHNPSLTIYQADPKHRNGAAIVIFPGGAHKELVFNNEGVKGALALNRYGITAFVLKYRLAREPGSTYTIEGTAAGDARRAVRWVRAHAAEYGVDPHRVGVMGFSAGGELVSLIADNPAPEDATSRIPPTDAVERESARPDFQILVFPGPLGVPGAAVTNAPPAFITAGSLDECCATPAVTLYEQLRKAKVPAELHMYAGAGHAFNLDESNRISILHWPDRLADWMADEGLLDWHRAPPSR
ncbi:MAG TPA: alpha/beta hydrolase [Allosphingosinicella sp.]|nr:alpha/beta hydrolase [Allosphingosinicella sp.]